MSLDSTQLAYMLGAIPGSVEPGIWTIRHSGGSEASVDLTAHTANIPGALTVWDAAVQQHEQGHIRWDLPLEKLGVLAPALTMPSVLPWYKMMREWVIDLRLVIEAERDSTATDPRIGMDKFDWAAMPDPAGMTEESRAQRWCQFAYVYTGSQSTAMKNHTGEIWALLPDTVRSLLSNAFNAVTDRVNAYDDDISAAWAIRLAAHWDATRTQQPSMPPVTAQYNDAVADAASDKWTTTVLASVVHEGMSPVPPEPTLSTKLTGQEAVAAFASSASQDTTEGTGASVAQTFASTPRTPQAQAQKEKAGKTGTTHVKRSAWGDKVIICDHLSTARPGKRLKAPKGASEEGVVLVDLPRVFQDGRPFKTGARPSGTIIVDTSGSMHWTVEQLEEVIRRAPGVVVGLYSAAGRPCVNGARICIVARSGRRANIDDVYKAHRFDGGNRGSDLPSLQWLADRHQTGPKFIISDGEFWSHEGEFNGIANDTYQNQHCVPVMKAGKILRVPDLDQMIEIMNHRPALISDGGEYARPTKRRANNR